MSTMVLDGWRSARVRTVGVSFGVSLGLHALLLALVVTSFSRAAQQAPLVGSRVQLVWVDPAPAAAPPRGAPEGTAKSAPAVPPPLPSTPPVTKPASVARPVQTEKRAAKPKPAPAPVVHAVSAPVAPAPADAAIPPEIPAGVADGRPGAAGDTLGGAANGVAGGRIGGTGVLRLGDVATAPVLVTRVVPEYPRRARLAGVAGEVVLEVIVDPHGRVASDPKVVRAVPELERAAVAAVRQWRFRPARDEAGTAVAVLMEVPVRFVLHEATADASR